MADNWVKIVSSSSSFYQMKKTNWSPPSVENARTFLPLCIRWWVWLREAASLSQKCFFVITEKKKSIFKGLQMWFVTLQIVLEVNPGLILGEHKCNMWELESSGAHGRHREVGRILWEAGMLLQWEILLLNYFVAVIYNDVCDKMSLRGVVKKQFVIHNLIYLDYLVFLKI